MQHYTRRGVEKEKLYRFFFFSLYVVQYKLRDMIHNRAKHQEETKQQQPLGTRQDRQIHM